MCLHLTVVALLRTRQASLQPPLAAQLSNESVEDRSGVSVHSAPFTLDLFCSVPFCSLFDGQACDSAVSRGTSGISTCTSKAHVSRLFQHVSKFPGVKPSGAMKENARICTCATDSDLESGLGEATVILTAF